MKLKTFKRHEILEVMKRHNFSETVVRESQLDAFYQAYKPDPEDRTEISLTGGGSYIYFALQTRHEIEIYTLVEYF